jgi:hypothetical protein
MSSFREWSWLEVGQFDNWTKSHCSIKSTLASAFNNGNTQNIGVNYLTSEQPLWFAGPDIVASMLLTGKVPHIEKAIQIVPHGKQDGLGSVSLRGMVDINAKTQSLFKHVIEQRAVHESDEALHYWLKILGSSGSYGLFVELNPNEIPATKLKVFLGRGIIRN